MKKMTNKEEINVLIGIIAYSKMDRKILRLYGVYPILWPPDTSYWAERIFTTPMFDIIIERCMP